MTKRPGDPDPSTFRSEDEFDELFAHGNPNPDRVGCPSRDMLEALAARERPIEDPAYEHVANCSECYREFRGLQQAAARLAKELAARNSMSPFAGRRPCTLQERSRFVAHMRQNSETGGWLMAHYEQGCPLTHDVIVGREGIEKLNSFFKSIDDVLSTDCTGRRRFTLREALNLLQAPERQSDSDVSKRHRKIVAFQALFARPTSNPMVTIVEFTDDLVVVDGNHTAMAALLYANDHPDVALPVYVLTVPSSVVDLG